MTQETPMDIKLLIVVGGIQTLCGIAIFITDMTCIGLFGYPITVFLGTVFGLFYMTTGCVGVASGFSARDYHPSRRRFAITALVLTIIASLTAFPLLLFCAALLAGFSSADAFHPDDTAFLGVLLADLIFFFIMFISCIVMCVGIARVMSQLRTNRMEPRMTHVVTRESIVQ
ncbi:uncharacterized protein LOC129599310 [Paramacrobiotus metropolitanus]|uniref:uncharacterized protein LOC129599310 n=1 Tax=Paramacrobiotus metropolitanus TaxID=2943436 RepID=UPI002445C8E3|nr:uncharacterized protein LOC129599310 [Paramacrobiotus metropolitanus]